MDSMLSCRPVLLATWVALSTMPCRLSSGLWPAGGPRCAHHGAWHLQDPAMFVAADGGVLVREGLNDRRGFAPTLQRADATPGEPLSLGRRSAGLESHDVVGGRAFLLLVPAEAGRAERRGWDR